MKMATTAPTVLKPVARTSTPPAKPIVPTRNPVAVLRAVRAPAQLEFQFHRQP
jgi:hypothetical protein